ncbi:hypothetical protein MKW92_034861 [Papaver armeniacum]|nr:hypothetical protein MKW92_034861 [Papaver armeniacum]
MSGTTANQMSLVYTALSVAVVSLILLWRQRMARITTTGRLPPGPPGWPVVGNLFDLGTMPHQKLANHKHKYGPLIWLRLGSLNTLVVSSVEATMEMFKNHDHSFCNRYINEAMKIRDTYKSTISLGDYGPYWRMLRRLCASELFSRKSINGTAPLRRKCVDKMLEWIANEAKETGGGGVEVARYVYAACFNVMGSIVFSRDDLVDPDSTVGNDFFNFNAELTELAVKPNSADFFPSLRWLDPQGLKKKIEEKQAQILHIIGSFIKDRRRATTVMDIDKSIKLPNNTKTEKKKTDFLDVLMDFEGNGKDEPTKISDANLTVFILELFMGATETTSTTVEWAMTELLRNPETMKKAKAEIAQVIGHDRKLEENDIKDLPYLNAVIKETLRLHPAAPLLAPRIAVTDTELMGYRIPKDTMVLVNIWGMGRDPNVWGADHLLFKPERFLSSNLDYRGQNFEFIPFGAGRRICPGISMTQQMLPLALGSLVQSFEWVLENGITTETIDLGERMGITLRKANPLKAVPRLVTPKEFRSN